MMYLSDCLRATMQFLEAPPEQLKQRTYNVTGMSFTPEEIVEEMKSFYPNLEVSYHPDSRQNIGEWREERGGRGGGGEIRIGMGTETRMSVGQLLDWTATEFSCG